MPQNQGKGKGNDNNPHNNGNDHNNDGHPDNGRGPCFDPHHHWHYRDHNTGNCTVEDITCPKGLWGNNHYSHTCDPVAPIEPITLDSAPEPSSIVLFVIGLVFVGVWRLVKSKTTRQVGC